MGDVETIKSFLVGLGFGVDEASLAKFNSSIVSATKRVAALAGITQLSAAGIAAGITEVSKSFEQMGYEYHIIAPAINKALLLRQELLKAYTAAGINIRQVVKDSIKLNLSLAKTKFAFEAIYKSVASRFFEMLTKQSDLFRQRIYANMPKIQQILESLVRFIFKALDATTQLGLRLWGILSGVYDFFAKLDGATDGWSTRVLGLIAIWKALNLSFINTPLGRLISLGLAILALWDDFKTFQEGGRSFINWGSETTKMIVGLTLAIGATAAAIYGVVKAIQLYTAVAAAIRGVLAAVTAAQWAANVAMAANPVGLVIAGVAALIGLLTLLYVKWNSIKSMFSSLGSFFSGIGEKAMNFLSSPNVGTNLLNGQGAGVPQSKPLGSNPPNVSSNNQNVQQQTSVQITGVPDANKVGDVMSGVLAKQNFDLVRNLSGAVRAGGSLA